MENRETLNRIRLFRNEKFVQYFFVRYPNIITTIQREFDLDKKWILKDRDIINGFLNSFKEHSEIRTDGGLMDESENVIPIELEGIPNSYTLIQVPHYCYRARYLSYRKKNTIPLEEIRTLLITIGINEHYISALNGPACSVRAIYPTDPQYKMKVAINENPVFFWLQELLEEWMPNKCEDMLTSEDVSPLGKLFISSWLLFLGDSAHMAEIRATIEKTVKDEYGSMDELIERVQEDEEIAEILALILPKHMKELEPEQLKELEPEQLKELEPEQLKELRPEQLKELRPEQLKELRPEQLKMIPLETLKKVLEERSANSSNNEKSK